MLLRPAAERVQRLDQSTPERGQGIFNFRRHNRMNLALHKPVAFQAAQGLRQHLLLNAANLALQRCVATGTGRENVNNQRRPFVRDPIEDEP